MLLLMLLKDHWELRMDVRPESLVLTPPSGSGEAWAPSSSFSRFYSRTQGSEGLLGSGPSSLPSGGEEEREPTQLFAWPPDSCSLRPPRQTGLVIHRN